MSDPATPKSARYPRSFGKYQILREAGRGGGGVVYEATDTVLQRGVALKVLLPGPGADPETLRKEAERFLVEARIGAHLPKHPHIVAVYEAGEIEGKPYLAAEFIQGESMAHWRKKPGVSVAQQARLLQDVALAIEHAHQHGVVHRDLKPGNILVDPAGQPRVTDFGLAKMAGQALDLAKAAPGHIWGTPAYMSPEHARGLSTLDHRADVYSLGAMLYEILAGRPLFQGTDSSEAVKRVVTETPPPPSSEAKGSFPPAQKPLEALCLKALSKDPAHRPASAKAFADELGKWLDGGRATLRRTTAVKKSRAPALALGAAAVVAGLVALALVLRSGGSEPPAVTRAEEARGRERAEQEKQKAAERAADAARREEAERGNQEKQRLLKGMEARRQADEEQALKQQAALLSQRQEAEERARKAEEQLRQAGETAKPLPPLTPAPVPAPAPPPRTPAPAPPPPPTPAPGAARNAPASPPTGDPKVLADGVLHFEAEDYGGGDGAAAGRDYHDTTAGNSGRTYRAHDVDISMNNDGAFWVGVIDPGEWLGYRFEGEGRYELEVRSLSNQNANVHLEVDGVNVTGPVVLPATAPGAWSVSRSVTHRILPGTHALRFVFDARVYGLDWFRLKKIVPAPTPSAAALRDAEKTIRALFKADYARKAPADVQALAHKLLQEGLRTEGDPAGRYALIAEARELAAQSGDPVTAFAAVEELDKGYVVDAAALKLESIAACARSARTPDATRAVAEAYLGLADEAAEKDEFEAAVAFAGKAEPAARGSQDAALIARVQNRMKELAQQRDDFRPVKAALKTLADKPDDPAANLAVGTYRCFTRHDWARGLAMLAKGSDAALAALAQKELAGAEDAAKQLALGDAWQKAGEKKTGVVKSRHNARALSWYEKALPGLAGMERLRIEGTLETLYRAIGAEARKGLVFWVEPGRDGGDPFREHAFGSRYVNTNTPIVDAGARAFSFAGSHVDYVGSDAVRGVERAGSIFAWVRNEAGFGALVNRGEPEKGTDDLWMWIQGNAILLGFNHPDNPLRYTSRGTLPGYRWTFCGVTWDERSVTFYIDGKEDSVFPVGPRPVWPPRRTSRVRVGAFTPGYEYRGQVGFVMMYNRPLPAAEIGQLYAASRNRFK